MTSLLLLLAWIPAADVDSIRLEAPGPIVLAGRDSWHQLLVTGSDASKRQRDVTRLVKFRSIPAGLIQVDDHGLVTPLKEGTTKLTIDLSGKTIDVPVTVRNLIEDVPVPFTTQIVPILTKFSCNAGGCHGKAGGQNGFSLSLLGFEPAEDYEFLVKENRGRRIFASSPERSLLLLKATGILAHGGGKRIEPDSAFYSMIRRWIEQGAPLGSKNDPVVTHLEIFPAARVLSFDEEQQLAVHAHFSDGSVQDVTRLAQFEVNDMGMAEVSSSGLVTIKRQPGNVAVMARYQTHVAAFRATVPLGETIANLPAANNFVDELVYRQWKELGLPPSNLCDDGTFLRRATLDLAGRLPTLAETKAFLADASKDKAERLIDRLLASDDHASYFAGKWSSVLRNRRTNPSEDVKLTAAFHGWIKDALKSNKPFDRFVREIVTVAGDETKDPAVVWIREIKDPTGLVEDVSQLFLGQRVGCAKCHHHPLEKWSQHDYWGMVAFFSRLEVKDPPTPKKGKTKDPIVVTHKPGVATAQHPRTKENLKPSGLGGETLKIEPDVDPRHALVDWMTTPENPFFAKTLANRYWKHFFGRGLVDPEDDMRVTNPPTNPALLDALAKHFIESKFDLKQLARTICTSNVYRLSAVPNRHNAADKQNYSRFYLRRMNAEVLLDAIDQVAGTTTNFKGAPAGTRAVELPDNQFDSYFLSVFGRPDSASACECERSGDANLAQSLYLFNSDELLEKIRGRRTIVDPKTKKPLPPLNSGTTIVNAGARVQQMVKDPRPHADKIKDLYLLALSREPSADELQSALAYFERKKDDVASGYEDLMWALVNTKEFLFNH